MSVSSPSEPENDASRRQVVLVALAVALIWAVGQALPGGWQGPKPPTSLEYLAFVAYSVMLGGFAVVAWLLVRLAPPHDSIRATGWILAIGGLVGAVGNLGEDAFQLAGFEYLYGIGLLGVMVGLIGLPIALAVRRQAFLAGLSVLTLVGLISGFGHGPPLMPIIWVGFAIWVVLRGVPRTTTRSADSRLPAA